MPVGPLVQHRIQEGRKGVYRSFRIGNELEALHIHRGATRKVFGDLGLEKCSYLIRTSTPLVFRKQS